MSAAEFDSWNVLTAADHVALAQLNQTSAALPTETVTALVMRVAERCPDSVAVEVGGTTISYRQLISGSRKCATALRALGIGRGDVVAILAAKQAELYPLLLAALAVGAAIAAIDPQAPPGRIARSVGICSARLLVYVGVSPPAPPGVRTVDVTELYRPDPAGAALAGSAAPAADLALAAYVTFTSGSTGVPKPVLVSHLGLANLIHSFVDIIGIDARHRLTQSAPLHYDASWQQIFAAWTTGAALLPVPDEIRADGILMGAWLLDNGLSHWDSVPSMWYPVADTLAADDRSARLRRLNVVLAGEPLRLDAVARWLSAGPPTGPMFNVYGPSEATIDAMVFPVSRNDLANLPSVVPIGRPIGNVRCYVLNENLTQCPIGVIGELYLGGAGLAVGYMGNSAATAERFLPDPFSEIPGARMYATGDLVRLTAQGTLEFGGRRDEMIKLRGVRIDLAEVRTALDAVPGVERSAVVLDREREYLVAFVGGTAPADSAIYHALAEVLPPSYLPARIARVGQLPLTPAGKIDRTLLQRIAEAEDISPAGPVTAAEELGPTQQALAEIWQQALSTGPIGLDENFFTLGGDSITSIVVRDRAASRGIAFEILDIFRGPTIRQLAEAATRTDAAQVRHAAAPGRYPLLPGQTSLYWAATTAKNQRDLCVQETYWLAETIDAADLAAAMDVLVERHPALRVTVGDDEGRPWQSVSDRPGIRVHSAEGDEATVRQQEAAAFETISIGQWPLFDLRIVGLPGSRGALIWTMHHVISDGWSHAILRQELFTTYRSIRDGRWLSAAEPTGDRYLEVIGALPAAPANARGEPLPGFRAVDATRLPRTEAGQPGQQRVTVRITAERTAALSEAARGLGLTVNAMVMGAVAAALGRFTDATAVTLLCVTSGRSRIPNPESAVGCFINTLPARIGIDGAGPAEVPARAEAALRCSMEYESVSAGDLCQRAAVSSLHDFSDVLFLFQSYPDLTSADDLARFRIEGHEGFEAIQFPLTIVCQQAGGELILDLDHLTSDLDTGLVEALGEQIDAIISGELAETTP
jgi:nonribosomal peptide synthetase protein VioF